MTLLIHEPDSIRQGLTTTRAFTRDQALRNDLISSGVTARALQADSKPKGMDAMATMNAHTLGPPANHSGKEGN